MNNIAVVILNFNGEKFLVKFLPILLQNTPQETIIYVADNASTDTSIALLDSNFPTIKIIRLSQNYGFAEGYNQALKQIKAQYYILLNSDVEVTSNWLPPLIEILQKENIAACQPKILAYYDKNSFEHAGAAGGFIDTFGYPFCRGRIVDNLELDLGQYNTDIKVFWATGACLAIKADLFHKYGGFDPDFFAHMEEIDLCWRLQLAGYEIAYTSKSVVYHVGGGTLPKANPFKTYLNFRNGLSMIYKNLPKKNLFWNIFTRLILDGIISLGYLFKGQFLDFFAVIKAHFSFYWQLKKLKQKRKLISVMVNNKPFEVEKAPKILIFEYFKNSKIKFENLGQKIKHID